MSWRFIFAILLVAAGASAWGGLKFGDWLVAHGPVAPVIPELETSNVPVLDVNGLPFMASPPQPLVNGTLGVPVQASQTKWQLSDPSISDITSNPAIHIATTTITMDEARVLAEGGSGLSGIADVGSLGLGGAGNTHQPLQPVEMAPAPPAPEPTANNNQAWKASLRQDLQACSAKSFFDRPSCAWSARNKYCEPNKAWGRVPDCPAKSF